MMVVAAAAELTGASGVGLCAGCQCQGGWGGGAAMPCMHACMHAGTHVRGRATPASATSTRLARAAVLHTTTSTRTLIHTDTRTLTHTHTHPPAGLNISLDSLRPERFEALTRRRGHHRVLQSIQTALELGFDPVKVCVCVC
jgi:hypothetical protein